MSTRKYVPLVALMFALSLFSFPVAAVAASSVNVQQFIPNPHPDIGFYTCNASSPCPMGPTDYGVNNNTGYSYTATAFVSWANFTKLNIGDCNEEGCNGQMTLQQNTVAYNIWEKSLSGKGGDYGEYWIQDVPYITQVKAGHYEVNLLDNIWNFSSTNTNMPGTLYGNLKGDCAESGGQPEFYYCLAKQTIDVTLPFELEALVNVSILSSGTHKGSSAVTFTIGVYQNGTLKQLIPFDEVAWAGTAKTKPDFKVGGQNPLGLYNDAEDVLCGPGGGSSVKLINVKADMMSDYLPVGSSSWTAIPHAWSAGTDTAETVYGADVAKGSGVFAVASHGTDDNVQLW